MRPAAQFEPGSNLPVASVEIHVGGQPYTFDLMGQAEVPAWANPVFQSLVSRWGVEPGWDGHRAVPTSAVLVARLLTCLQAAMPPGAKPPIVTPLYDGGVQAEWHRGDDSLEIVVAACEPPSFSYFGGEEHEGLFWESVPTVQSLIANF
jgi:hypothetical protein